MSIHGNCSYMSLEVKYVIVKYNSAVYLIDGVCSDERNVFLYTYASLCIRKQFHVLYNHQN